MDSNIWIQKYDSNTKKIVETGLLCGEETGDSGIRRVGNITFL